MTPEQQRIETLEKRVAELEETVFLYVQLLHRLGIIADREVVPAQIMYKQGRFLAGLLPPFPEERR